MGCFGRLRKGERSKVLLVRRAQDLELVEGLPLLRWTARLLCALGLVVSFVLGAAGQTENGEGVFAEEPVRAFSAMAYGDDFFEGILFVDADDEKRELAFRPDRRSDLYLYPAEDDRIRFFREVVDEEGRVRNEIVAEADVSEVGPRALLVFRDRDSTNETYPYRVHVADESEEVFGGGAFRFLNLCPTPLYWRIGDNTAEMGPGFSASVRYEAEDRSAFPIALAARVEDDWKIVFSTRSQSHSEVGTLFVVKPPLDPDSLNVRVHALRSRLRPLPGR